MASIANNKVDAMYRYNLLTALMVSSLLFAVLACTAQREAAEYDMDPVIIDDLICTGFLSAELEMTSGATNSKVTQNATVNWKVTATGCSIYTLRREGKDDKAFIGSYSFTATYSELGDKTQEITVLADTQSTTKTSESFTVEEAAGNLDCEISVRPSGGVKAYFDHVTKAYLGYVINDTEHHTSNDIPFSVQVRTGDVDTGISSLEAKDVSDGWEPTVDDAGLASLTDDNVHNFTVRIPRDGGPGSNSLNAEHYELTVTVFDADDTDNEIECSTSISNRASNRAKIIYSVCNTNPASHVNRCSWISYNPN